MGFACLPGSRQRRIQGELNFSNTDIPHQIRIEIEYVEMYIKPHKSVLHNPDFFFRVLSIFSNSVYNGPLAHGYVVYSRLSKQSLMSFVIGHH